MAMREAGLKGNSRMHFMQMLTNYELLPPLPLQFFALLNVATIKADQERRYKFSEIQHRKQNIFFSLLQEYSCNDHY